MPQTLLIDSVIRSIQTGSLYALMALGITLTFAVMKLPNFAHAEYITVGAYAALIVSLFTEAGPLVVMLVAFVAAAVVALLTHFAVFRPMEKAQTSTYTMLLSSFAIGLILRYILFLMADTFELFDKRIGVPLEIMYRGNGVILTNIFVWVVPTSIVLVILLSLLLNYTELGREMRALAINYQLAQVIGIRVERVKQFTWLIVGGMAGVAGALWGIQTAVNPLMGWLAILSVFAAAILGGLQSYTGTILGAYVVAFSENTLMQVLHFYFDLNFSFKPAIPFIIIILVLLFRPQGFTEFFNTAGKLKR
ncbi:MAG: branched-chain amino acid ABC transporter permease [Chloroflexota bacterium]